MRRPRAGELRWARPELLRGALARINWDYACQAAGAREPWRRGLAHLPSPGTVASMKPPEELAAGGMQTLRPQRRGRLRARPSYVDETLFGRPAGTQLRPPDFDPPWVVKEKAGPARGVGAAAQGSCETTAAKGAASTLTPKKKNKYRLLSHTPSHCDESLFGRRCEGSSWEAPWTVKGNTAKLHALLWTPPPTPRGSQSPRPRETPLRAVHPAAAPETKPREVADSRRRSLGGEGSPRPPGRARSQSLTLLSVPSPGPPTTRAPPTREPRDPRPPASGVTFRSPLVTPRALSVSVSVPATPRRGAETQKPKPPWR